MLGVAISHKPQDINIKTLYIMHRQYSIIPNTVGCYTYIHHLTGSCSVCVENKILKQKAKAATKAKEGVDIVI